jgi:hypothetical protein
MSLYGGLIMHDQGAIKNAKLIPNILPGWKLRIYTNLTAVILPHNLPP